MESFIEVFDKLPKIIFWLSPFLLIAGAILVLYGNYKKLEDFFGKEFFRAKVLPKLESNIFNFHEWVFERRTAVGIICITVGVIVFFIFRKY